MLSVVMWWTGVAFWTVAGIVGCMVIFCVAMHGLDWIYTSYVSRAGSRLSAFIFLRTWALTKDGRSIKEAAAEAASYYADKIRAQIEKEYEKR